MKSYTRKGLLILAACTLSHSWLLSQGYEFKELVKIPTTQVRDQQSTGTCWCFATTSFLETELLRMGKGEFDFFYYLTKNSRGPESNTMGGNLYMSEAYVKLKTIAVMVHKDAVPKEVWKKMNK